MSEQERSRTLLVRGERLRVEVSAPPVGGGEKYEPQTAEEARVVLLPKVQTAANRARQLPTELRGPRIYVEARLLPNYVAASHFPDALFTQVDAVPVGSRPEESLLRTKLREQRATTRQLILAISDSGLDHLERLIEHHGPMRSESQAFEEIRKLDDFGMRDPSSIILTRPLAEEGVITWEAVLHPRGEGSRGAEPLDPQTMNKWFALIGSEGGEVFPDFVRRVGGLTFSPVRFSVSAAERIARFNPLRALRPIPTIRPLPTFGARSVNRFTAPISTAPRSSSPTVAVFDGGLDTAGGTAFFPVPSIAVTSETPSPDFMAHGTGVGGAVMYGLAQPGGQATSPALPVDHYRVLPAPSTPSDLEGYWVLDRIKEQVSAQNYRLVNLSLGPTLAVEDTTEPNRWTSELDQLAWERDVLFVVASGNDGHLDPTTGLHRVQVPGDMVNGLTVGACDLPPPGSPWMRAPYSSMGPGRQGNRIQPAGLQFGGALGRPFPVLSSDGRLLDNCGTSFAAPLVTHALSGLAALLPKPIPAALRAFAIHFAERPRQHSKVIDEVGYGRFPLSFVDHLHCDADEVHVLFLDRIKRGEYIGYQLPLPGNVRGGVELILTLCYCSPVDPTESTEYTRAALELVLRPHQFVHRFTPPTGATNIGARGRAESLDVTSSQAIALLQQGWHMSQEPVTKALGASLGRSETALRDAGKWETVRHHRLRLKDGEVSSPRLEISYVARRAGFLDSEPTEVPFALLVTLRDSSRGGRLYDETVAAFPVLSRLSAAAARIRVR